MRNKLITAGFLLFSMASVALAQSNHKDVYPYSLYETGKKLFQEKVYGGSIRSMEDFIKESDNEQLIAEAKFIILYAASETNQRGIKEKIQTYMKSYPVSLHTNRLKFLLASAYYKEKDYVNAITWFDQTDIDQLSEEEQDFFFYRSGYAYLQQKEYATAGKLFDALCQNSTQFKEEAIFYSAYTDYCQQKYADALEGFEKIKTSRRFEREVPYYIAQIQFIQKNYGEAVALGKKLLKKYPDHENKNEIYRIIGTSYYHLEDYENAITYLSTYKTLNPNPLRNDMYLLGMAYYNMQDYENAMVDLGKAVGAEDAVGQNAYLHIGQCALKLNDKNRARISFEAASRYNFDMQVKEQAMYNYALVIHETSFSPFNESLVVFEKFLNLFPNSAYSDKVNDYLVETYLTTKNYDAALASIGKIKKPGSKILEAKQNILFHLGAQSFANSDFNGAIKRFNESLKVGDYNRKTETANYFWRGEAYYRLGDYISAVKDYQSYFSTNKSTNDSYYALAHYNIAYAYMKQQKIDYAMNWFNKYVGFLTEQEKETYADALNRIGDCYYYQRDWQAADEYYEKALANRPDAGDYATYQRAFVLGLKKQYGEKIALLDQLIMDFPRSEYQDDAYYEKGRSLIMLEKNDDAIHVFTDLMDKFPESNLSRKAGTQIGLIYFNNNKLNESVAAYKNVISKYPGSEEAKVAMDDLKSVYMELDQINDYAEYVRSIDGNVNFNVSAQDSLTYLSAERLFLRGDMDKAKQSMENYLQNYPTGAFSVNAHFYLGNIYYDKEKKQDALKEYKSVLDQMDNKFYEDALARCADITYTLENYEEAFGFFNRLLQKAEKKENKDASKIGILRCANILGKYQDAVLAANILIDETNVSPEIRQEAYFVRAKAFIDLKQEDKAMSDLKQIVGETRTVYGAEANYILADCYYRKNQLDAAEKAIFTFIEKNTPHQYWMARCFILLSDVYVKKGDAFQAKEYLISLRGNYKGKDDIEQMIQSRLDKLNVEKETDTNTEQ